MSLSPGTQLGRYEIRSMLGAGGMGEVYLAEDTKLDRQVAIKFLNEEFSQDTDKLKRFIQEAKAASALNHPNILTVYEIGEVGGKNYISTEFIEGETLREHLSQKEAVSLNAILKIGAQVAEALSAAHQAGIVHRDIKPENIMLRRDGLVKLLDFGLAKLTVAPKHQAAADSQAPTRVQIKTNPGVIMGTMAYMSPEQARGREMDARTDIWSLGVVLYEVLVGQIPFAGETRSDVLAAILKSEPPPLKNFNPEIPAELERIISKALTKDREQRYQTAKDLLIDLRHLKKQLELQTELERSAAPHKPAATQSENATQLLTARPTSSMSSITEGIRKHRLGFALALSVFLLAAIGLGYWLLKSHSSSSLDSSAPIKSIAVMPFVNGSGNADVEYLSDGMTESLIGSLSQIPKLNVKARSSVFRYKGKDASTQTIGKELNVQAILTGRITEHNEQLVLNLELADAQTENVIWSKQYNHKQTDLVSLQNEITQDVSTNLRLRLSGAEQQKLSARDTDNSAAYQLYLKGNYFLAKRTRADFDKAVEYYQQAIALDPNFALAYTGLSEVYALISPSSPTDSIIETNLRAKEAALRAMELNPNLPEANVALGYILSRSDKNWTEGERLFRRAIDLNPNYGVAHMRYGEMMSFQGRHEEALGELRRAIELEPLSLVVNRVYGTALLNAGRADEAIAQFQQTVALDENSRVAHFALSSAYERKGEYAEAVAESCKGLELAGDQTTAQMMRRSFAENGWRGFLLRSLEYNQERAKTEYVFAWWFAATYAKLGDKEKAFEWLEKSYQARESALNNLKVAPGFSPGATTHAFRICYGESASRRKLFEAIKEIDS